MAIVFGSGEGSSPSDPPFAQMGGSTSGGWKDTLSAGAQGAFNAIAPDYMKKAVAGVGDARAFQKRRDAAKFKQQKGGEAGQRQLVRDQAMERLKEYGGGD